MKQSRTIPVQVRGQMPCSSRIGFTLIEMLMAVTLVLIMMVMFAEVFQLAGDSVNKQRTLADNDQNARTFVTIIRADLDKRTFRTVVPFYPNELSSTSVTPFSNKREGYFSLNCNSSADGSDDVLQFTVKSTVSLRNTDESPYYGAAEQLPYPGPPAWNTNPAAKVYNFIQNPNQPDRDDGQVTSNGAASSRAAEISYFLRYGKLYRRVMLIRDPIPAAGVNSTSPAQPMTSASLDYFAPANGLYTGNLWGQFDFSAYRTPTIVNTAAGTPICARFVGLDFLRNDLQPAFAGLPFCYSLGQTWNRFGHNHEIAATNTANGVPREYSSATTPNFFIGRFSQEETSNTAFQYPQFASTVGTGNPMDAAPAANALADTSPADGVVDSFAGGSRAGVDLLLSNVHEFRVEAWDDRLGSFAPIGHNLPLGAPNSPGDYNAARFLNGSYGPLGGPTVGGAFVSAYDTWHPMFDRDFNNSGAPGNLPDRPPYRPLTWDATLPTAVSGFPPGPAPTPPTPPFTAAAAATFRKGYWAPGTSYSVGNVVFPCREDLNGNGFLDAGEDGANGFPSDGVLQEQKVTALGKGVISEDLNNNAALNAGEDGSYGFPPNGSLDKLSLADPGYPAGMSLAYRCIKAGTSSRTRSDEPNKGAWSKTPGQILRGNPADVDVNGNGIVNGGDTDWNGNGYIDPAEPDWIVDYNVRPLRAIRITVRFQHPTSQKMKQVTIVHSLRDTTSVP